MIYSVLFSIKIFIMKKNYQSILSLILIASISFVGCKKTQEDYTSTAESAESFAQDQPLIFSSFDMFDDFLASQNFMQKNGNPIIPGGATITYFDSSFDDGSGINIGVNFGPQAILCGDNIFRSGSFRIYAEKPYSEIGSQVNIVIKNDLVIRKDDDVISIHNVTRNYDYNFVIEKLEENKYSFKYYLFAAVILDNTTDAKDFIGEFFITKSKGFDTPEKSDDEISIDGNGTGFSSLADKPYDINIESPLIKTSCAKIFTKGKLTLQNEGSDVKLEINFGDGTCDSKIEVKSGAFKKEITL